VNLRIGLTGGIGSGKSTVAAMLVELGAHLVDTDAIARELTLPGGAAMPAIVAAFGPEVQTPDGALDRPRMRDIVFHDPAAKQRLEAILHPMIREQTEARAALAQPGQVVVFDVPLLAESKGWRERVDRILVVDCSEERQIERVQSRNGWPEDDVQRVIAQQATRAQRLAIADDVIRNEELSLADLKLAVAEVWANWPRFD